jgi:hypothetical protein
LLPSTLGDLTTTDAIFGRLIGALAVQDQLQDDDLHELATTLKEPFKLSYEKGKQD